MLSGTGAQRSKDGKGMGLLVSLSTEGVYHNTKAIVRYVQDDEFLWDSGILDVDIFDREGHMLT